MGKWARYWRKKGHIPKSTVGQYRHRSLDSSDLFDNGTYLFKEGEETVICGTWARVFHAEVFFALPTNDRKYSYSALVETTECNYGGVRHWFLCPNPKCKRRSKKLYMGLHGYFLCRKCLKLGYFTQTRSKLDRIIDKKWALVHQLGAKSDWVLDSERPKGMHWNTFNLIREEIEYLDGKAVRGIAEWCG